MARLLTTLVKAGLFYGISELLLEGRLSRERIKRAIGSFIRGIFFVSFAGMVAFVGMLALAGSLFFLIAEAPDLAQSAFFTAVIILLASTLVFLEGYSLLSGGKTN
jgi:hypothetical protein